MMTPEQRKLVSSLVTAPAGPQPMPPSEFLRSFGADDGQQLAMGLLRQAVADKSSDDLECALIVAAVFGVTAEFLEPLSALVTADWHFAHENVVSLLGDLHLPEAVPALFAATQWVPDYLEFDDSRALAVKAIYALGATPGDEATGALRQLLESEMELIRTKAEAQLQSRDVG